MLILICLAWTSVAHAQIRSATITGTVTDPQQGVVPGATVVVTNEGTNATVQLVTNESGLFAAPLLPAGTYSGSGSDEITVESQGGRNGARGPSFFQADARLGYRIKLGGVRAMELFGECFNVTNEANFANPTGDRFSTNFLRLTALRPGGIPRTFQFGARFGF